MYDAEVVGLDLRKALQKPITAQDQHLKLWPLRRCWSIPHSRLYEDQQWRNGAALPNNLRSLTSLLPPCSLQVLHHNTYITVAAFIIRA